MISFLFLEQEDKKSHEQRCHIKWLFPTQQTEPDHDSHVLWILLTSRKISTLDQFLPVQIDSIGSIPCAFANFILGKQRFQHLRMQLEFKEWEKGKRCTFWTRQLHVPWGKLAMWALLESSASSFPLLDHQLQHGKSECKYYFSSNSSNSESLIFLCPTF